MRHSVWMTQEGEMIEARDMTSTHLFFSIRMIFNHSVPESLRLPPYKRYRLDWPSGVRRSALHFLITELSKRDATDLQPWMWKQLEYIRDITTAKLLKTRVF